MHPVYDTLAQVHATAALCASRGLQVPALILTYSSMDTMGWMLAEDPKAPVRQRFTAWVDKYALPAVPRLQCTSTELYAARCGILHTFTVDSALTDRGVRKILYSWGNAQVADLERATQLAGAAEWVAVRLDDLVEALRLGTERMLDDAASDPVLTARIMQRAGGFFTMISKESLAAIFSRAPGA